MNQYIPESELRRLMNAHEEVIKAEARYFKTVETIKFPRYIFFAVAVVGIVIFQYAAWSEMGANSLLFLGLYLKVAAIAALLVQHSRVQDKLGQLQSAQHNVEEVERQIGVRMMKGQGHDHRN